MSVLSILRNGLPAVLLLLAASAPAAEVASVRFEQHGEGALPEEQLRVNVQLHTGGEFRYDIVESDVRHLAESGDFSDVSTRIGFDSGNRAEVVYVLELKPRVSEVLIHGNAKFPTGDLAKELTVFDGARLNDKALLESLRKLRDFYREKGYKDASVSHTLRENDDGTVTLTFEISEGLRVKVNDVTFEGNTKFSERELRNSIANHYSYLNWLPFVNDFINDGLFDKSELELDIARLREKYHGIGCLDFKLIECSVSPDAEDPEFVNLHFKIEEGEPYTVGTQSVTGNTAMDAETAERLFVMREGEIFSSDLERRTSNEFGHYYSSLGYADMECRPVRSEDAENHTVDITYQIKEGRKYRINHILFIGNTGTKEKVLRRELAIQPGDPVDADRIEVSRQRLMGMGYFSKVEASAVGSEALDEKDVRFEIEEKQRYNFRIGAGASDLTSLFGTAEFSVENFDLLNPMNGFYGGGQRLRMRGIVGFNNNEFSIDFVEPWLFDIPLRYELSGYLNNVSYDDWDERRLGVRTGLNYKIFDDFTTVGVGYKFEQVRVHHVEDALEDYMDEHDLDGNSLVSQFSFSLSRNTLNDLMNPTNGYTIGFYGSVAPEFLGTSSGFYHLEGRGSYYHGFWDDAVVLMLSGQIGVVGALNGSDNDVPVYERYFLGGGDTLRGFDYRSVAPSPDGKHAVGGNTMLALTGEISHPIWGPVRGAVFADVGTVAEHAYRIDIGEINVGVGYGLRIRVPVINAPIKLDLAYPVVDNQSTGSRKLRLHFNLGFTW